MTDLPDREETMRTWDHIREYFKKGDAGGTHPRDLFEAVIDDYEAAIASLKREVLETIEEEQLWEPQTPDDEAYNQAVADVLKAVKRCLSRARGVEDGEGGGR